jgi:hypothetical protein
VLLRLEPSCPGIPVLLSADSILLVELLAFRERCLADRTHGARDLFALGVIGEEIEAFHDVEYVVKLTQEQLVGLRGRVLAVERLCTAS